MGTSIQLPTRLQDDSFIDRRGKNVLWQRSLYCSCYDQVTGQPDFNCSTCLGLGYIYEDPVEIKILMTNVKQDKSYSIVGVWELGTCRATFKATVTVGFRDRISFLGMIMTYSDIMDRAKISSLGLKDLLRFSQVKNILSVRKRNTVYREGIDYQLTTDTNNAYIEWLASGTKPTDGDRYSILYEHLPEFIVWDVPQIRTDSEYYQLPKFAVLRRKDMIDQVPK